MKFSVQVIDQKEEEYNSYFIYLLKGKQIEEVEVKVSENQENINLYLFELFTSKSNSLPFNYKTPITPSTLVQYIVAEDTKLTILVSDDFNRNLTQEAFYCLMWTYYMQGYLEVEIIVLNDKIYLLNINDYLMINPIKETLYYDSKITTLFIPTDNGYIPITYFHQSNNICQYIFSKLVKHAQIDVKDIIIYENKDDTYLYYEIIDKDNIIDDRFCIALKRSFLFNKISKEVIIIKNKKIY